ncbi:hypothetical protein K503DRAFT_280398 [Rhizopogon vinicolor AM-OR11-026]|uniref:Uncharacterized protein n=1 Tax=Rhizopogon vinicolor AM-OR11-026 TaxID=1314800 RepID=A0A1B7MVW2_9AGAM|nr:hypothetical protein K503DRAFT_280398 [Rhizopogon vinicolor AM-OR11-026]
MLISTHHPILFRHFVYCQCNLSNWRPIHTGRALRLVVDVPLTRGDERNAAAGAPRGNGGHRRDEDFDSCPPSPTRNPNSQPAFPVAQTNTGDHGSSCSWCCL